MNVWRWLMMGLLLVVLGARAQDDEAVDFVKEVEAYLQQQSGEAPAAEDVADALNRIIVGVYQKGDYRTALAIAEQAFRFTESRLGPQHPSTLVSVNNLAFLYRAQGRYGEAEPLFQRALAAREKGLGPEHPDTLVSVNNLASLYESQGRYGEAEPLYQRALAAREKVLGPEHPNTLVSVNNLASLYESQGRYGEAEPLYQRALAASEKVLGPEHPSTLGSVNNLAFLYQAQGRYGEAAPLYQRALASAEASLGVNHPNTLTTQLNYIAVLVNQERFRLASIQLKRLEPRLLDFAATQLYTTQQERVRRDFLLRHSNFQDVVLSLALGPEPAEFRTLAADVMLRWKRVQGEEEAFMARLLRHSDDPTVQALGEEILTLRGELSHLANLPEPDPNLIQAKHQALEAKELALATISRRFKQHLEVRSARADSVRAYLPGGSALLELRQYRPADFKTGQLGPAHWAALLLPAEPDPEQSFYLYDLGPVADTRRAWWALRGTGDKAAAADFYRRLFGPLDERLQDLDTLYVAPDGFLNLVALSRLVLPDGRYWLERQDLRLLQTGRDLLRETVPSTAKGLLAIGGVEYQRDGPQPPGEPTAVAQVADRNRQLAAEIGSFEPLANSAPEIEEIAGHYWDYAGGKAQLWQGRDATEARLKTLAQAPRILHLATHGFYLSHKAEQVERPLVLAGLALAGANHGLRGVLDADGEDGVLYALEVQHLNLEGTELVALSACDTGRGAVDYTEGVYGLVRAFRIAGARDVLMTLWPIGDAAAKAFITEFYRNWLRPGLKHPALALRETQLAFIADPDPARRDPDFWAPFVLVESR